MKNTPDLVIFDLDGTVLDTLEDLADSVNSALCANGFPTRTLTEIRSFVGNGIKNLILRSLPHETDGDTADRVLTAFRAHYADHCADKTRPYDGIPALLAALKADGFRTAVVSNKTDGAVQRLALQYFPGLFDFVTGEREGVARKPAPDSVNAALSALGAKKENAVYVGDSEVDVLTAQNAGIPAVIVTWGFRDESFLREKGAELIAHDAEELEKLIRNSDFGLRN